MKNYNELENTQVISPRRPILAALMSAALPGFGQLYNGQVNRAAWFFVVFSLVALPVTTLVALFLPLKLTVVMLALSVFITLGVWVYGIADAWRVARKLKAYVLKPWQTSSGYGLVFIFCSLVVLPTIGFYVRDHQAQAFRIPSSSMVPTLKPGDFIFTNKSYNCPHCRTSIKRGDVSVFVYPNNRNLHYIKRIIGLPGDVVAASAGVVSINGAALSINTRAVTDKLLNSTESVDGRSWTVSTKSTMEDFSVTVKPGYVFVLGDNRTASNDSRVFGQVPLADVVGRARQVWFSYKDFSRIGKTLIPSKTAE